MELFKKFIKSKIDLPDEELDYVPSLMKPNEYIGNSIVLRQGEIERYLSYIEKGMARYYYMDQNGKETSLLFTFENWFLGEVSSFLTQSPSFCFIETLADTKVWRIHHDDLQKVYSNTVTGDRLGRLIMEQLYLTKAERERNLLTQTAEQRYLDLFTTAPHILKRVQLKHIASYLGITPQALSRIRRRIKLT